MVVCHMPYGPTAYFGLYNCVMRHDIGTKAQVGTISEAYPNCIFENFGTKLGKRFETIIKALFPVPKPSSKRLVTFANKNDYISMRYTSCCILVSRECSHCCCLYVILTILPRSCIATHMLSALVGSPPSMSACPLAHIKPHVCIQVSAAPSHCSHSCFSTLTPLLSMVVLHLVVHCVQASHLQHGRWTQESPTDRSGPSF